MVTKCFDINIRFIPCYLTSKVLNGTISGVGLENSLTAAKRTKRGLEGNNLEQSPRRGSNWP